MSFIFVVLLISSVSYDETVLTTLIAEVLKGGDKKKDKLLKADNFTKMSDTCPIIWLAMFQVDL